MAEKQLTLEVSKKYLERWAGSYLKIYLNENGNSDIENIFISNSDEDKILKIDLKTAYKSLTLYDIQNRKSLGIITAQVKTHTPNNINHYYHSQELENNDYFIFYEKPFSEELILENNYANDQNALYNSLQGSCIHIISTEKIKELSLDPNNDINDRGSNGKFYVIPDSVIQEHSNRTFVII